MESKLESLLNKMEGIVQSAEQTVPKTSADQQFQRMEQLLQRLEKATQAGGTVPAGTNQAIQEIKSQVKTGSGVTAPAGGSGNFDKLFKEQCFGKVDALMAVCTEINNEGVTGAVNVYLDILKSQSAVFNTMASCSKPESVGFMLDIAKNKKKELIALEKKNRKFMNHIRCVEDSINLFAWYQIPNEDKEQYLAQLTDFYGAIDFMGNKMQDVDLDKKWYRAFREVQKDFYEFIKSQYPAVLQWTGSNADAQGQYNGLLDGKITVQAAPQVEEKKPAAPAKKPAAAGPKAAAPKKPVKVQRGLQWEISNYIDEEIVFDGEDDVFPNVTFNFFNCEKCKVTIPGKFKNFMLNKCKRMELHVDSTVSMGEIIKCERVQLHVANTCPQVSIELSNGVQVYGTLESKNKVSLVTTASQSVSFIIPKDPGTFDPNNEEHDPNKTEVVPETFCSKFIDGKFTTVAEEGGFD